MAPLTRRYIGPVPYNIAKGIRGPSTTGPYTRFAGWDWKSGDEWETGPSRGAGHNLGLT